MRAGSLVTVLTVLSVCPALVDAFVPAAVQPNLRGRQVQQATALRSDAGSASLRGRQVQHATVLRSDAGSASFGEAALPFIALSYVDARDVERLQEILTKNGARNVGVEQARFGQRVMANVAVERVMANVADIATLVRPSGQVAFEGIRADEAAAVKSALAPFFEDLKVAEDDSGRALVSGWRIDPWMVPGFSSLQLAEERERDRTNSAFWKWID
jgi:hypothetical protein